MKKIVIRIVCYNQEDVISRALDSVLCQKEWGLYKIVVSDDCSTDRTWEILKNYESQYPEIVEIHRNEKNQGIYGNVEMSDQYVKNIDYDLFGGLSGDDEYCDGYFEGVQKLVEEKGIDTTEPIGIYSDWKCIYPDGGESFHRQAAVLGDNNLFQLKIRGIITNRSLFVSKVVKDKAKPTVLTKGLRVAESCYDIQYVLNIHKVFYTSRITTIYYAGIGVSKHLNLKESDYMTRQNIEKWNYLKKEYIHEPRDIHFADYEIKKSEFYLQPTWCLLIQIFINKKNAQLPNYRLSFKRTIWEFLSFLKYKLVFKKGA